MSFTRGGVVNVNPSYTSPQPIVHYNMPTGVGALLAETSVKMELGSVDQYVYQWVIENKTASTGGQTGSFEVPSGAFALSQKSTPVYEFTLNSTLIRSDAEFLKNAGFNAQQLQKWSREQAYALKGRDMLLYGHNASLGEGIMNAPSVTHAALLAMDTEGETVLHLQRRDQVRDAVIGHTNDLLARNKMSASDVVVGLLMPQNEFNFFAGSPLGLLDAQAGGGGSRNIWQSFIDYASGRRITIELGLDETLIDKGVGGAGTNAIVMNIIAIKPQSQVPNEIFDVNSFAKNIPNADLETLAIYLNSPAPIEYPTPTIDGGIHTHARWRMTAGWVKYPAAFTVLSVVA